MATLPRSTSREVLDARCEQVKYGHVRIDWLAFSSRLVCMEMF